MKSYNETLSEAFNEIADLLALLDENFFKILAYRNVSRRLKEEAPITQKNASVENLRKIKGVGVEIAAKIMEFIKTGKIKHLEELRKKIPEAVRDLLKIPHLGPKRVRLLHITLGIKSKKELIEKAKSGEIEKLPGFGKKLVKDILTGIEKGQEKKRRHERKTVEPVARRILILLKKIKGIQKVEIAGSYRRGASTVGDIDILVQGDSAPAALKLLQKTFKDISIIGQGDTKLSFVIFPQNLQVDIRFVPEESWGAALLYFTGSKEHNVMMRKVAIAKGYLLNEYGLFDNGEYIAGATEEDVFKKLNLKFVPPQKRV